MSIIPTALLNQYFCFSFPQAFLRLKNNLMVMFEEHGGRLGDISIVKVKRDNICMFVSEYHPAHIKSWVRQDSQIRVIAIDVKPSATLKCPEKKVINQIMFASFGSLMGVCGNFTVGNCHTPQAKILVEKVNIILLLQKYTYISTQNHLFTHIRL